jgi:hypothetical protein
MMEDYRAGAGMDRDHDIADRNAGKRLQCPLRLMLAKRDDMERLSGDPLRTSHAGGGAARTRGRALFVLR